MAAEYLAEITAHARTDVPTLLAEVERLRAELAQVREAAAAARCQLGAFVHDSEDPGTGALGALHMLGAAGIPAERGDLSEEVMARHVAAAVEEALADRPTRAQVLREAKDETVAWLTKKAGEHRAHGRQYAKQADVISMLASKADRGAIRCFLHAAEDGFPSGS